MARASARATPGKAIIAIAGHERIPTAAGTGCSRYTLDILG